jgi:hypothetical protein
VSIEYKRGSLAVGHGRHSFYFRLHTIISGVVLSEQIRYYKGLHKVKVLTESVGYWIVEALEDFEDIADGEKVHVKLGEQRIVPPNQVFKEKTLPPMVKEHAYELKMEKKLKRMLEENPERNKKGT